MEHRQLYNIETDTLITLVPKNLQLIVKHNFTQTYYLELDQFTTIYLLCIWRPHVVEYKDFKRIFTELDLSYPGNNNFIKKTSALKRLLRNYNIRDLIVKVKGFGYTISNKWIPPQLHTQSSRKQRFMQLSKLAEMVFSSDKNSTIDINSK